MKIQMSRSLSIICFLILLLSCLAESSRSQTVKPTADDIPIRVKTILLNVPVIVSDRGGRRVAGMKKEDFVVTQGGEQQTIDYFADVDAPMNVAIIVDTSISTSPVLSAIKNAAREFIGLLGPEDRVMIIEADYEVRVYQSWTSDKNKLFRSVAAIDTAEHPGSYVTDALYRALNRDFTEVAGRKAIVVLTDGDIQGKISPARFDEALIESDVTIYPIFFQTRDFKKFFQDQKKLSSDEKSISVNDFIKNWPPLTALNKLANSTGGRLLLADGSDFSRPFGEISNELKKQYVIGFYPKSNEEGYSNKISIDVLRKDVIVRMKNKIRLKPLPSTPQKKQKPF